MKVKNLCIVLLLLSIAISASAVDDPGTLGFIAVATPTLALSSSTATIVGTIPNNTHTLTVNVDVDTNYGPSSVATGTNSPYIPAGTSKDFEHIVTPKPTIYLRPRTSATGTATLRAR